MHRKPLLICVLAILLQACAGDDSYQIIDEPSPVVMDLTQVPYPKLSDYLFFSGDIKNLQPSIGVLPYKPTSELFTDYAKKSRFIWLPSGTIATITTDEQILQLPVGSALIKTFWYDQVQPNNVKKILETRLLIKKEEGWTLANYKWNEQQTEAFLDTEGGIVPLTWIENNTTRSINYQIPSANNCITCHTLDAEITPIGIKPQNLNSSYPYPSGLKNQLHKMVEVGYLASVPGNINSLVDYNDTSQNLDKRVRSYLDINCAHCHRDGGSVDFLPVRFAFEVTTDPALMGVCVGAIMQPPGIPHGKIIAPGNTAQSVLYFAMSTNLPNYKMPRIGRTIVHLEAVQMVEQWINSMPDCP